jgi:hypothetical protein
VALYLDDKVQRRAKLLIKVPAHHCAQECPACGQVHPDQTQALLFCSSCGRTENADTNAAKVLAKRAVHRLLAGAIEVAKLIKRGSLSGANVDSEGVKPLSSSLDNNAGVDHGKPQRPKAAVHRSRKPATHTPTPFGVSWRVLPTARRFDCGSRLPGLASPTQGCGFHWYPVEPALRASPSSSSLRATESQKPESLAALNPQVRTAHRWQIANSRPSFDLL